MAYMTTRRSSYAVRSLQHCAAGAPWRRLTPEGLKEIDSLIAYYMENAKLLRETMLDIGLEVHGGTDAP